MSMDVLTFGEALYRFTPHHHERFSQAQSLGWHVAGAELNVAVGLAHLGLRVGWLSRLTDNALGQRIAQTVRGYGVDTSAIIWTPEDRIGLYFVEDAPSPRMAQVIYDRAGSAFARIQPDDLRLEGLAPTWLHTTGITLALSATTRDTTRALLTKMQAGGARLSFDVNYRAKLWSVEDAVTTCEPFLQSARLIFIAERDARLLYGLEGDAREVLRGLASRWAQATVVMSRGAQGVMCGVHAESLHEQEAFPATGIGRIGGGDALAAGCLYAHLTGKTPPEMLRWGAAFAALKYATAGDLPLIPRAEVEQLLTTTRHDGLAR